jgi:hypothetical protein
MVRSLGLLAIIIVVLLFIGPARSLILPGSKDRMPPVDYSGYVHGFDVVAGTDALVPDRLPSSWRPNAATVNNTATSAHLHIGWAVPGSAFAGLDEGTGDTNALLRLVTGKSALSTRGDTTIAGATWTLRRSDRGETVYTRDLNGVFVIVTGSATDEQLRLLAASLR